MKRAIAVFGLLFSAGILGGCSSSASPPPQCADKTRVERLRADVQVMARATGCSSVSECATAPVGSKPCGGPREYIVYCMRTTDNPALQAKLDELKTTEAEFNQACGTVSNCMEVLPPPFELSNGECRVKSG